MTLRIIRPLDIREANIVSTNLALETEWTAGTYSLGDTARVGEYLWEVSAETTTEEPGTGTDWFSIGPANRYAAFDQQFGLDKYRIVETVTRNADSIEYELTGLTRVSGIAMFGIVAQSIHIRASQDTPGDIMDMTYTVKDSTSYNGSMWRWLFLPQSFERKYLNLDLNIPAGATIEITLDNTGGTAAVGSMALGVVDAFGIVTTKPVRSIRSRSIKKTDGSLTSLLRRTPSAKVTYPVTLLSYQADPFWRLMDDLDGVAAVFAGPDNYPELSVYGFHSNVQSVSEAFGRSTVSIEVETL